MIEAGNNSSIIVLPKKKENIHVIIQIQWTIRKVMVNISLRIYQSKKVSKVLLSNLYAVRHMQVTYVVHIANPPPPTLCVEIRFYCGHFLGIEMLQ